MALWEGPLTARASEAMCPEKGREKAGNPLKEGLALGEEPTEGP